MIGKLWTFSKRLCGAIFRHGWWLTAFVTKFVWREFWANLGILVGYGFVGALGLGLTIFMLVPSYKDPSSRMYTSGMGYGSMKRKMGLPFDVSGARVKRQEIEIPYLGEGLVTGAPTRVAMKPMAQIERVHVEEGDRVTKGQLLLELDDLEARRKLASAELALRTARAELGRVEAGSTYVLEKERPEFEKIRLDEATEQFRLLREKLDQQRNMLQRGLIAETSIVDTKRALKEAEARLQEAQYSSNVSKQGVGFSLEIAQNAVLDAEKAVEFEKQELSDYKIYAPGDGIISAVLVREGEFNSDLGKPAFLITSGKWFEGYFDQAVLSRIQLGQEAEIFMEAYPGEKFAARVTKIIPEVTFSSGGPEIARPMRPRGTGAPEWAATFRVRFEFVDLSEDDNVTIGMTGNVKVRTKAMATVVPRNGVLSVAASRALVTLPLFDELNEASTEWTQRPVKLGYVGHDWAEVADGLQEGEVVLVKGHRIIREGDAIQLVEIIE
ncbi:MAG: HlyD family secretion protein [Aureliella sp.]